MNLQRLFPAAPGPVRVVGVITRETAVGRFLTVVGLSKGSELVRVFVDDRPGFAAEVALAAGLARTYPASDSDSHE